MKHNEQKRNVLEHSKNEKSSIIPKLGVASRDWSAARESKETGDELILYLI